MQLVRVLALHVSSWRQAPLNYMEPSEALE